jgi:hypothetical protein
VVVTSLDVSWTEALGAVSLFALLPWAPALLFGGGSFAARRLAALARLSTRKTLRSAFPRGAHPVIEASPKSL